MAIKELKSIKFPGLEDTYIIPENNQCATIPNNVSGNMISLDDAANAPLNGLKIFGKTTQNGTPTPDAPVPLESVGNGGSVEVNVCGKNLLNIDDTTNYLLGMNGADGGTSSSFLTTDYIPVKPNASMVLSVNNPATNRVVRWVEYDENQQYVYNANNIAGVNGNTTKEITTNSQTRYIRLSVGLGGTTTVESYKASGNTIQLEYGAIATEYEPYSGQTMIVSTPNGLPGIPVSSGGNYTDETGQQWICDEVDFARGKYVQRITTHTFTGTENFEGYYMGAGRLPIYYGSDNLVNKAPCLCNCLVSANNSDDVIDNADKVFIAQNGIVLHFDGIQGYGEGTPYPTEEDMRTALREKLVSLAENGTPLQVQYILAEPIEADLTAEELAQYSALHTNSPNTTIHNDAGADMEVKYYTPKAAVPMIHDASNEGKVLAIDAHGCVVLSDDIGGGNIDINLDGATEGEITPINADTLGGVPANDYMRRSDTIAEKNYSVVGDVNTPESPTENMIWINTEYPINNIYFGENKPLASAYPNDVWITTGSGGPIVFNSLKIGSEYVNSIVPLYANQYINGEWVDKEAHIWQNGQWHEWWTGKLYDNGREFTGITGGFGSIGVKLNTADANQTTGEAVYTYNTTSVTISSKNGTAIAHFKNKINLKDYSTLTFKGDIPYSSSGIWRGFGIWTELGPMYNSNLVYNYMGTAQQTELVVDLTNLNEEYYIGFWIYSGTIRLDSLILT